MRVEKYQAVAQIVSAILAKPANIEASGGRPLPGARPEGFVVRLEEGRIYLHDADGSKMTLEELIQYVDRYLG